MAGMGKRFTATEKWADPWFRGLSALHKLGFLYLCDNCESCGVIDLDRDLANFQVGDTVDWNALIDEAAGRIEVVGNGKLWLTRFVEFQYGEISEACAPHRSVLKCLDKYSLRERVSKPLAKGSRTLKDKDKDKDKTRKGDVRGKPIATSEVPLPDGFDSDEVRKSIHDWLSYKVKRGEGYKDAAFFGRKLAEFSTAGPAAFIAAVNSSIGSNYAGLFPAKDHNGKPTETRRSYRHQG
jgi:hypothetical protein